jgi:hypothetical protein
VSIEQRLITFIKRANWILFALLSIGGLFWTSPSFARGIIFGGLIVTANFHLLSRTLRKAFTPPHIASHNIILIKYYIRFIISGIFIFLLICLHIVNPLGLFVGLSVVVASMMLASLIEIKRLICKEAV